MTYNRIALKLAQSLKLPISGEKVEQQEMPGVTGRSPGPWPHIKDDSAACVEVKETVLYSSETSGLGRSIRYVHEYICRKTLSKPLYIPLKSPQHGMAVLTGLFCKWDSTVTEFREHSSEPNAIHQIHSAAISYINFKK